MNDYDFSTLNDKEFERLSLDLLNAKFNLKLQAFKSGRDKGIDLRYSSRAFNNKIVVQVKHYVGSSYSQLKHTITAQELGKVKLLKPERYIVVTSLPLSASQKDELRSILDPFVLSSNDIIGKDDLNSYLRDFPHIEKNHFKLWFSSVTILNTILNNAIESRSKYHLERIKSKIPFYVVTSKLDKATRILNDNKILLITGQPGIGKTTLADILLFSKARQNYQIYKVENIREAEDVMSNDNEQKQVFYFDDFLGANYNEIINASKTETQLTAFVERVRNTPNKYLILTTRTVILNHAVAKYEKIGHSRIADEQFELKLGDYSKFEKALILYNHLFFKNVKEELYNSILLDKFYKSIISHKNYTPRIIEFITDKSKIDDLSPEQYKQFIRSNLANPKEIWRYSFNNQIEYLDRCLLLTLFTFSSNALESDLIRAFEERLSFEKEEHNQIVNSNQFNESIKILLDGFISSILINSPKPIREYTFINPSLADFLLGYVSNSYQERKSIISSIVYAEQLKKFIPSLNELSLEQGLQLIIRERVSSEQFLFLESREIYYKKNHYHANLMDVLFVYCKEINIDSLLVRHLKSIDFTASTTSAFWKVLNVLRNLGDAPMTEDYIRSNFFGILHGITTAISEVEDIEKITELFEKYNQNYSAYSSTSEGTENLIDMMDKIMENTEENFISDRENQVTEIDEVEDIYNDIDVVRDQLISDLFPGSIVDYEYKAELDWHYWNDKINENRLNNARIDEEAEMYADQYREDLFDGNTEDSAIDDLFNKSE